MGCENPDNHLETKGESETVDPLFCQKGYWQIQESGQELPIPRSGATNSIY